MLSRAALAALLLATAGCSAVPVPAGGAFRLPAPPAAPAFSLNTDPLAPAFGNAFGGYVGSLDVFGPLAAFVELTAIAYAPDGMLYVADEHTIRRIGPDAAGRPAVVTVGGDDAEGTADGPLDQARFGEVRSMAALADGSLVLADGARVRRVVFGGAGGGTVTTIAGDAAGGYLDGVGGAARFAAIVSLAVGPDGTIWAAESNRVRRLVFDAGTGLATATTAYTDLAPVPDIDPDWDEVAEVQQVAVTAAGRVWIAGNATVRRLQLAPDGTGTPDLTVTGTEPSLRPATDGPGVAFGIYPWFPSLTALPDGDIAVGCINNAAKIRRITVGAGDAVHVSAFAKALPFRTGTRYHGLVEEGLSGPGAIAVGPGGELRVIDLFAVRSLAMQPDGTAVPGTYAGYLTNVARRDGYAAPGAESPTAFVPDGHGGYFMTNENSVYQVTPMGGGAATMRHLAGRLQIGYQEGTGDGAWFDTPNHLLALPDGNVLVADAFNGRIRLLTVPATGPATTTTFAGGGTLPYYAVDALTTGDGPALGATIAFGDMALAPDGAIYVADRTRVRKLAKDGAGAWQVTSLAGTSLLGTRHRDGAGAQARFGDLGGIALAPDGTIYAADTSNHVIRAIVPDAGGGAVVTTVAGKVDLGTGLHNRAEGYLDGPAGQALFKQPHDVALAPDGSLLVADFGNHAIRRVARDADGAWQVSTLVGPGAGMRDGALATARVRYPYGLEPDGPGRFLIRESLDEAQPVRVLHLEAQP